MLEKSAVVNGLRFPAWAESDASSGSEQDTPYCDPDGQPGLGAITRMADAVLLPEDLVQTVVTDCSVVAALSVCLGHQRRFGSKLVMCSLYPQDVNEYAIISLSEKYLVHVFLNSSWRKIVIDETLPFLEDGQLLGDCLVTLGTAPITGDGDVPLLPSHNYVVFDQEDDSDERHLVLHDPWCNTDSESRPTTAGAIRLTWRDMSLQFDTIHLSWNPGMFARRLHVHLQSRRWNSQIWVLLTPHIIEKQEDSKFISLNTVAHEDEQPSQLPEQPVLHGTYMDSFHVIKRLTAKSSDGMMSIIVSIEGATVDTRYSLTILSDVEITGSLSSHSSGGNHTYPTFMNNPHDPKTRVPFCFTVKGPKDLPLNAKIVWSTRVRTFIFGVLGFLLTLVMTFRLVEGDVLADTRAYSYRIAYGERDLKVMAGQYTLIVSAFEPRQIGTYELSFQSLRAFDIEPLPTEGAGMYPKTILGTWKQDPAAGAASFGKYLNNPWLKISIPSAMHILIRMQLLQAPPSNPINITLDKTDTTGAPTTQVFSSSSYSDDATPGVLIPHSAILPGTYILIPSVYMMMANVELPFQILLYATGGSVEATHR
ncbi:hypothetical protein M422DRAFT_35773 [Sphaerobolus stellatus SS14]|uniref:Calpain catalytic domain-containing protein n=1 Tax=Sphaerobolus stellatus (strain SS14) TaxID=990650 RepID=A0A0C9TQV9_SPHS4|nr:hypothetical protein M422DRAFT_35773 [Sphaerobolus stellatus SS14]